MNEIRFYHKKLVHFYFFLHHAMPASSFRPRSYEVLHLSIGLVNGER